MLQNAAINIDTLYYITHIDNLMSIINRGILAHAYVEKYGIAYTPISDGRILEARKDRATPDGKSLWNFVNLFFNPRNPMLYRVLREKSAKDILIIGINPLILCGNGIFITTGNARSQQSKILAKDEGLIEIQKSFELKVWANKDGSKSKIMAECLIPNKVPSEYLQAVYVVSDKVNSDIKTRYSGIKINIIPEPYMFFRSFSEKHKSLAHLGVVKGSVFFSRTQDLAVNKLFSAKSKYHFVGASYNYQNLFEPKRFLVNKSLIKNNYLLSKIHWISSSNIV